ncbi:hypothetical protein M0804_000366 [Polistes exclamans]|nr:hypothetical protein M0804_000366 [Polistes exclamans]
MACREGKVRGGTGENGGGGDGVGGWEGVEEEVGVVGGGAMLNRCRREASKRESLTPKKIHISTLGLAIFYNNLET